MGRDSLEPWSKEELAVIKRRETLSNGKVWPMEEWDSTEFEEFFQEIKQMEKQNVDR